jgi:hypothetical protein
MKSFSFGAKIAYGENTLCLVGLSSSCDSRNCLKVIMVYLLVVI